MTIALLQQARDLLAGGDAGAAVSLLQPVAGPHAAASIHTMLGYALYADHRVEAAEQAVCAGLARHPDDPGLHEALARIRWMRGVGLAFADEFLAAIKRRPRDLMLRLKCADLLRLAEQRETAERLLREAMPLAPGQGVVEGWLAVLLDEMGKPEESAAMSRATLRAYPQEAGVRLNLAHALLRLGRGDEAMREIRHVRQAAPHLQLAITYEGMALRQTGDPRHDWLCDYRRHVMPFDLEPPAGFADIGAFNHALAERVADLIDTSDHPLEQSLRGGAQTNRNLTQVNDDLLAAYFEALREPITAYVAAMGDDPAHPLTGRKTGRFELSGCWAVRLKPGGFHVNHTHPDGWISSAYYVSLPASMSSKSQEGWIKFGEPRWPVPGCGIERVVQPQEGRLVLFPSFMWHGTIPFSSGERLTAPFDVVPVAG